MNDVIQDIPNGCNMKLFVLSNYDELMTTKMHSDASLPGHMEFLNK